MDDGSTDQTRQVVESFSQVNYYFQVNQGVSAARNKGAEMATGDWLIFLDSDDQLENNVLEIFGDHIKVNPDFHIFAGGYRKVISDTTLDIVRNKLSEYIPLSGTYCLSKSSFLHVRGFDTNLTFSENTELFHRLRINRFEVKLIPKVLLVYFQNLTGGSNNISNQICSLEYICLIHKKSLSIDQMFTYYQILGVLYLRRREFKIARLKLFIAWSAKPYRLDTFLRLLISNIPILSNKIYI